MKKHYKTKESNKIKLKSYLKNKSNKNTNERDTGQRTGSTR